MHCWRLESVVLIPRRTVVIVADHRTYGTNRIARRGWWRFQPEGHFEHLIVVAMDTSVDAYLETDHSFSLEVSALQNTARQRSSGYEALTDIRLRALAVVEC